MVRRENKTARILCRNVCLRVQACCPRNKKYAIFIFLGWARKINRAKISTFTVPSYFHIYKHLAVLSGDESYLHHSISMELCTLHWGLQHIMYFPKQICFGWCIRWKTVSKEKEKTNKVTPNVKSEWVDCPMCWNKAAFSVIFFHINILEQAYKGQEWSFLLLPCFVRNLQVVKILYKSMVPTFY